MRAACGSGRTVPVIRPNRILRIDGDDHMVATAKAPDGGPVPIQWLQEAVDLLESKGEVSVHVERRAESR